MTQNQFLVGAEADAVVESADNGGNKSAFTSLKSGTSLKVKVIGMKDYFLFYSYGIYERIDSFVAEKPSKKTAKGFPTADLTPWDKAWKYHKDLSQDWSDEHGQEASKYRAKARYAMGFFDLTKGESIAIDLSKKQHEAIKSIIEDYEEDIEGLAFTIKKSGSGTSTTVSLTPIINLDKGLTEDERKNFADAPTSIDMTQFFTAPFFANEEEQVKLLTQAGFDVSLIGYSAASAQAGAADDADADAESDSDDLPF
ncbi:hypothetical protein [Sporosarcina sp. ITBMC105]